jgi:hypothetical protein
MENSYKTTVNTQISSHGFTTISNTDLYITRLEFCKAFLIDAASENIYL